MPSRAVAARRSLQNRAEVWLTYLTYTVNSNGSAQEPKSKLETAGRARRACPTRKHIVLAGHRNPRNPRRRGRLTSVTGFCRHLGGGLFWSSLLSFSFQLEKGLSTKNSVRSFPLAIEGPSWCRELTMSLFEVRSHQLRSTRFLRNRRSPKRRRWSVPRIT